MAGLSGCALPAAVSIASYAVDGASFVATGRSMSDHGISILLREDCALFRVLKGEPVCRPMKKNDLVYDIAFAPRTQDYYDESGPTPARVPPQHAVLPAPVDALPVNDAPAVQVATARLPPPDPVLLPAAKAPPVVRVAALAAPAPPPVVPVTPASFRVIAGAFNQVEGAAARQQTVRAQLRRLGQSDVGVFVVRMPPGSAATYVVLTRPLEEQRADVLLGQLQLDRGDSPWKMRTDGSIL